MGSKLPDAKRSAIVEAIRSGGTCRGIAREHKVSHAIVSKIAKEEGLSFDRAAQTAAATAAAEFDARQARATLIRRSYEHAAHFLDRARAAYTTTITTQHGIDWVTYAEPSPGDQRNLMTSFGIAVDKALALEKHDNDGGAAAGRTMVNDLFGALRLAYHQIVQEDAAEPSERPSDGPVE